jgi:uncharacterized protein YndB with AHSA1/START domain
MSDEIIVEAELADAPEKVWRALTEPDLIVAWLAPTDADPSPLVELEVLEAEPTERVRYAWREQGGVASELEFTLTPLPGGGARLRVVHTPVVIALAAERAARRRPSACLQGGLKWAA